MSTYVFKVSGIILYNQGKRWYTMLDPLIVGNVLRELREKTGRSQEVVSGLADIGRTHLSALERGERRPTLDTLFKLAAALNMSPSEIVRQIERALEDADRSSENPRK